MMLAPAGAVDPTIRHRAMWTPRTALASAFCVGGALAATCSTGSGNCATSSAPSTFYTLGPAYRLNAINGQLLPAVFKDSGGVRSRVFADTLRFSLLADRTYAEAASVGTQATGQPEVVTRFVLADSSLHYTQNPVSTLGIPRSLGGSGQATLVATTGGASPFTLLTASGQSWTYIPIP